MRSKKSIFIFIFVLIFAAFLIKLRNVIPIMLQVISSNTIDLKKTDGNINILLLGIGGGTHDGPDLTDTIIFLNINQEKNKLTLVSIPRDLWIEDLNGKINTAYAIGESKRQGGGLTLAKAVVQKVINQPIGYGVVIDFDGFVKAVDLIGGLDITVDNTFDDYQYPIEDKKEDLCGNSLEEATAKIATMDATLVFPCRYEHLHFDKGLQHMDGQRTLKYVRSRYAVGDEGTDFARSRRQQKVIQAFRDKVFSVYTILNPAIITKLYGVVAQSIHTDIQNSEFDDFIRLAQKMQKAKINSVVIDQEDKEQNKLGLLVNPSIADFNGSWVLIPRTGIRNYSEIQHYVSCILTSSNCIIPQR